MIGGHDYIFYSILPHRTVLSRFKKKLATKWAKPYIRSYKVYNEDNEINEHKKDLTFAKSIQMYRKLTKDDEFVDANGEGPFSFYSTTYEEFKASELMHRYTYKGISKGEAARKDSVLTNLFCKKMTMYTLVLHESIDESEFSMFIYNCLLNSCDEFVIEVKYIDYIFW